jgi:hypothetical protein
MSTESSCRSFRSKSNLFPSFIQIVILIILLLICGNSTSAATTPAGSLSFYGLDTNGFVHLTKIDATNRSISQRNPDAFVITETKTNSACASKMACTEYQIFEERGTPVTGHHIYKWGAILGIKKSITVSQHVLITQPALKGRLIAVDVVIPLESGSGFLIELSLRMHLGTLLTPQIPLPSGMKSPSSVIAPHTHGPCLVTSMPQSLKPSEELGALMPVPTI